MHWILGIVLDAIHTIAGASLWALALAVALHLGKVAAEARSWHGIVSHAYPTGRVRFRTTFGAFAGAIGVNAVLPARIGDGLRLGVMRRRVPGSTVPTLASTVVLETAIEIGFGLVVLAGVLLAGRSIGPAGAPLALAGSHPVVLGAAAVALVALTLAGWVFRRRLGRVWASMALGMSVMRSPRELLRGVMVWKFVAWALRFAAVYLFLVAFHLRGSLWVVLLVVAAQNIAGMVPLAPGSAGTQQAALAFALAGTVGAGAVVGFGVGMQAATAVADIAIGIVACALVASWADVGHALRPARLRLVPAS